MEEQRNLTTRATDMDREIRAARLIEDQDIPTDLVAPGNHVILTEVATGTQLSYRLLGPWDMTDESVINYRAPIAKGILGRKVGDTGDLPGLEGPTQVRIEKIERAV
jgi:transcription elongation factor GreA